MANTESKVIVFDFDGTICDSYTQVLESFNRYSDQFHYKTIPSAQFDSLRDLGSQAMFESLQIDPAIFQEVVDTVIQDLHAKMSTIRPIPGIEKALHQLRARGHRVGVLTSNSEESVRQFAKAHPFELDFIYGSGLLFGKHELILTLMQELNLSKDQTLYVGDETRDIEAAHKAGIKIIAVDWGFNTSRILKTFNPDWLLHKVEDLGRTLDRQTLLSANTID